MKIGIFINIKTIDPKTNRILDEYEFEANSLVQAFIAGINANFYTANTIQAKDTSNATQYSSIHSSFRLQAAAGDANYGIVVGTGTNAVAVTNYALQTKIAHGTGVGQLQYSAMSFPVNYTVSAPDAYCDVARTVTNGSGADITVEEIGLITLDYTAGVYWLKERTRQTVVVPNTLGKTITYRFKVTV